MHLFSFSFLINYDSVRPPLPEHQRHRDRPLLHQHVVFQSVSTRVRRIGEDLRLRVLLEVHEAQHDACTTSAKVRHVASARK